MEETQSNNGWLDMSAQLTVLLVVFLLPIIALPAAWLTLPLTKMTLLSVGAMLALILWSVARLREHTVSFPNSNILWTGLLLILGTALSALLSGDVIRSFIGFGFERDTVFALVSFVGILAAVAVIFKKKLALVRLQQAILASFFVLSILQIVRLTFGAENVLPQIFSTDPTANLLGSWNDLAVFSGLILLGTLSAFAFKNVIGLKRGVLYAAGALALFLLIVVNLTSVWAALAVLSFTLAVYTFSDASYNLESNQFKAAWPIARLLPSVAVFVVSVLFLIAGSAFGERISRVFNVAYIDVRPSWEGTIEVGSRVYQDSLWFGAGPNTFSRTWTRYKPEGVNQTNFWNVNFSLGVGVLPTAFISGGLVVGITWLMFLASFLYFGFRVISSRLRNRGLHYLAISSFVGAAYLWVLSIVYVPQTATLALAFILTGAAVAAGGMAGSIRTREVGAKNSPTTALALIGALLAIIIISVSVIAVEANRVIAAVTLSKAVRAANVGEFDRAVRLLEGFGSFGDSTRFSVARANVGLLQLREILNVEEPEDIEAQRLLFRTTLQETIGAAQTAVQTDPRDYRNWLLLGNIYQQLVPLNVEGAYEGAIRAYEEAIVQNPTSPAIHLARARLQLRAEDSDAARESINAALALKSNYTDAYFLLSQIEISEGKTQDAIATTEAATLLSPTNPGLFFQLGILQYSTEAFGKATAALERATTLNENYANALYFLGLSYDRLDRKDDALTAFSKVLQLNPDNVEVASIVGALETGGSAFDALGEEATEVEKQQELPVPDEATSDVIPQ